MALRRYSSIVSDDEALASAVDAATASTRDGEPLNVLRDLGLTGYEARVYLALLDSGQFSASQVADHSGVPRQRVYDVLSSLVDRGLVEARPHGRGTRYVAVAPQTALPSLLETEASRFRQLETSTHQMLGHLSTLYARGRRDDGPLDFVSVLRGPAAITERLNRIRAEAREEVLVFTKGPFARLPQEDPEGLTAFRRPVKVRSIFEDGILRDASARASTERFAAQGEEQRFAPSLPMKLYVADGETVLFAMPDPLAGRSDLTTIVIENQQFGATMQLAFEAAWAMADDIDVARERLGAAV